MSQPGVLIINMNESRCGACGKPADPSAETHDRVLGYTPGPGCGERWTTVTTHYTDHGGLFDRVREMRPDLNFVPLLFEGTQS